MHVECAQSFPMVLLNRMAPWQIWRESTALVCSQDRAGTQWIISKFKIQKEGWDRMFLKPMKRVHIWLKKMIWFVAIMWGWTWLHPRVSRMKCLFVGKLSNTRFLQKLFRNVIPNCTAVACDGSLHNLVPAFCVTKSFKNCHAPGWKTKCKMHTIFWLADGCRLTFHIWHSVLWPALASRWLKWIKMNWVGHCWFIAWSSACSRLVQLCMSCALKSMDMQLKFNQNWVTANAMSWELKLVQMNWLNWADNCWWAKNQCLCALSIDLWDLMHPKSWQGWQDSSWNSQC